MSMRIGGIVLCGGESRRMGSDKALLSFDGETMLQRVVRVVGTAVHPVVVVAAPGQALPSLPIGVHVIHDEIAGQGPLQGMASGLAFLEGHVDAAYVSSCDVPLLTSTFVRFVCDHLGTYACCVPKVEEQVYPLSGAYRIDILPVAREILSTSRAGPRSLVSQVPTIFLRTEELSRVSPNLDELLNVNSSAAYQDALAKSSR